VKPPIYEPKGAAKEYGDLALNIYTGCPHNCYYCFAPAVLHKTREAFSANVQPRPGIVEAVKKQLEKEQITGKMIHLCFTCDPYPVGVDTSATREIIKLLKAAGNHVQILTKGGRLAMRDFDLLDAGDNFGVTYCGYPMEDRTELKARSAYEPFAAPPAERMETLLAAFFESKAQAWISMEPLIDAEDALNLLREPAYHFATFKIGKLNYHPSPINWHDFGHEAEAICKEHGLKYYIKDSLRAEMEKCK
jgi:DNA repair photolyase